MSVSEPVTDELQVAREQNAKLVALIERLFTAADGEQPAPTADHSGLQTTLDSALALLEEAVAEAERQRERADALEGLLARALDSGEALEAQHQALRDELAAREAALEEVIALSERSLAAAVSEREAIARLGFWRRLFGSNPQITRT